MDAATKEKVVLVPVACCPRCRRSYDQAELLTHADRDTAGEYTVACIRCGHDFEANRERIDEARAGRYRVMPEPDYRRLFPNGYSARVLDAAELRAVLAGRAAGSPLRWNLGTLVLVVLLAVGALVALAFGAFGGQP